MCDVILALVGSVWYFVYMSCQTALNNSGHKDSPERRDRFIELTEKGATVREAAAGIGVSLVTAYSWLRKDEAFRARVRLARALPDYMVKESLYNAAISGNIQACTFWLSKRNQSEWGDRLTVESISNITPGRVSFEISSAPMITTAEVLAAVPLEKS